MPPEPKAVVRRLYEEVWNNRRVEVVSDLISPSHALNDPHLTGAPVGPEAYRRVFTQFIAAFPDLRFTVDQMISEKDKVAVSWTISGTHKRTFRGIPATSRKISFDGVTLHLVSKGKIIESYVTMDYFALLQQLGVISRELLKRFNSSIPE